MSANPPGASAGGSRPKSALKAAPPPPPPPPAVDQAAVPPQPSASITCTVGQMSTRVDFANRSVRYADLAASTFGCHVYEYPSHHPINLHMMQSQFTSASSIVLVRHFPVQKMSNTMQLAMSNNMQLAASNRSTTMQPVTSVQPYVPRPVSNPMLSEWPPAKDNSLPKEGWFLLSDLWLCLPGNYQYDISEIPSSRNCSLMQGCFEIPWKQNPTIFVQLEFENLLIYDKEGPLQVSRPCQVWQ